MPSVNGNSCVVSSPFSRRKRMKLDMVINKLGGSSENQNPPIASSSSASSPLQVMQANIEGEEMEGDVIIGGCHRCNLTFTSSCSLLAHVIGHFPDHFYLGAGDKQGKKKSTSNVQSPTRDRATKPATAVVDHPAPQRKSTAASPPQPTPPSRPSPTTVALSLTTPGDLSYFMCPQCCRTFADTDAYTQHLGVHLMEQVSECALQSAIGGVGASTSASDHRGALTCNKCGAGFFDEAVFHEHMRQHALSTNVCPSCNKAFLSEFDLNLHLGSHLGYSYDCKDCGRCFESRKLLAEHNKSHRVPPTGGTSGPPSRDTMVINSSTSFSHHPMNNVRKSSDGGHGSPIAVQGETADEPVPASESAFNCNNYIKDILDNITKKDSKRRKRSSNGGKMNNHAIATQQPSMAQFDFLQELSSTISSRNNETVLSQKGELLMQMLQQMMKSTGTSSSINA